LNNAIIYCVVGIGYRIPLSSKSLPRIQWLIRSIIIACYRLR